MNKFTRNLLTEWRKLDLPFANQTVVAAVSGGADSVSLLLTLHELKKLEKLNLRLVIAHFNHDLRGAESEADEDFVRKLTVEFGLELVLGKEKISGEGNLEQNARNARYKFLSETAENLDAFGILTAHTLNDQAETFLHNLLRGSGLPGLGGMKSVRSQGSRVESREAGVESQGLGVGKQDLDGKSKIQNLKSKILLIRPLLNWAKREDTENFCRLNKIEFRNDSMNEDLKFNRVRIRKILLPLLQDFNPKIIEILAQTAFVLREENEFLDAATKRMQRENYQLTEKSGNQYQRTQSENRTAGEETKIEGCLSLKELVDLFPSMRRRIICDWLVEQRGNLRSLDAKHFEAIENLIFSRKSGKKVELPNNEFLLKNKGNLIFMKDKG